MTLYLYTNIYHFKNKKYDKIKLKFAINQAKSTVIHLDELSNYYFSRFGWKISWVHFSKIKQQFILDY